MTQTIKRTETMVILSGIPTLAEAEALKAKFKAEGYTRVGINSELMSKGTETFGLTAKGKK